MGYYINENSKGDVLPSVGKLQKLIADGAVVQTVPTYIPEKSVCVIENGMFDAAAYAYCEEEFNVFLNNHSGRPKTFLEYEHAKTLAE